MKIAAPAPATVRLLPAAHPHSPRCSVSYSVSKRTTRRKGTAAIAATGTTRTQLAETTSHDKKKILVPVALGSEEIEVVVLADILRRAGADVTIASVEPQLEVRASLGVKLVADSLISSCQHQQFDLVVLPGGMPGSARLRDSEVLRMITQKHAQSQKLYGAISAAPAVVLEPWGLLKRKKMTCHPAFMENLSSFWAVQSNVQVSRGVTTSRGPGTAIQFALSFVEQLFGTDIAENIGEQLVHGNADCKKTEEYNPVNWTFNSTPRALIPICNGSKEMEAVMIVDILRRARVDVVVASLGRSLQIQSSGNTKIIADKLIKDAANSTYDMILIPGGNDGGERLFKSKILKQLLEDQRLAGRIYGEICSPNTTLLGKMGLFEDKMVATCPSSLSGSNGKVARDAGVVIDGTLITSRGSANTIDFSLAIIRKLFGEARARSVSVGIVFEYSKHEQV